MLFIDGFDFNTKLELAQYEYHALKVHSKMLENLQIEHAQDISRDLFF